MRLDWIFLPRENPCAKCYIIITIIVIIILSSSPLMGLFRDDETSYLNGK